MTEETKTDGRKARRGRSRERIVQAAFLLVERGNWRPSVKDIAAQAGVSVRTVFDIFGTLDDVYEELMRTRGDDLKEILYHAGRGTAGGALYIVLMGRSEQPAQEETV